VEVYPQQQQDNDTFVDADKHATELFLEVNKAEPVKLVDMPGVAKKADRKSILPTPRNVYKNSTGT
jgi:hypothetical protein